MTGAELRAKRKELGYTQIEFAELMSFGKNTIINWERQSNKQLDKSEQIEVLISNLQPKDGIGKVSDTEINLFIKYLIDNNIVKNQDEFGETLGYAYRSIISNMKKTGSKDFIDKVIKKFPFFKEWLIDFRKEIKRSSIEDLFKRVEQLERSNAELRLQLALLTEHKTEHKTNKF